MTASPTSEVAKREGSVVHGKDRLRPAILQQDFSPRFWPRMQERLRKYYRSNKPSGILTMLVYRFGNIVYYRLHVPILRELLLVVYAILDNLVVKLLCGAEFPARCRIGKGLRLPHGSNGILLHGDTIIGDQVMLCHQVSLGMKDPQGPQAAPHVGNFVIVGMGSRLLGNVTVGDHATIGANAVVITDVPAYSIAVGVPARVKASSAVGPGIETAGHMKQALSKHPHSLD